MGEPQSGGAIDEARQAGEAVRYFKAVTQLVPDDQMAWLGLGDACRLSGNSANARTAYRKGNRHQPAWRLGRESAGRSNAMAQAGFETAKQVVLRQDQLLLPCCSRALRLDVSGIGAESRFGDRHAGPEWF